MNVLASIFLEKPAPKKMLRYMSNCLIQLSQKQKTFFEFLFAFLKSILNFEHLLKKDDPRS